METQQQIEFNKSRTGQEIFSDYWLFMKSEWKPYCIALGVFVLPFALIGAYFLTKQNFDFLLSTTDVSTVNFSNMYLALGFSFLAKFFGMFVSCAYVTLYIAGERIDVDSLRNYITNNFLQAFLATLYMALMLFTGMILFFIPALIILPPMSILLYDVLIAKQPIGLSFMRCFRLCQTNFKQSYGVVYLCYIGVSLLSWVVGGILPADNSVLNIIFSSILTVLTETVMIPFILLYYSLGNQNMKS